MLSDKNKLELAGLSETKQFIGRKRRQFGRTENKIMNIVMHDFFNKKIFQFFSGFPDYIYKFFAFANLNSLLTLYEITLFEYIFLVSFETSFCRTWVKPVSD
jgi:hypothetical protein